VGFCCGRAAARPYRDGVVTDKEAPLPQQTRRGFLKAPIPQIKETSEEFGILQMSLMAVNAAIFRKFSAIVTDHF
jgi:hypothetical protein